MGFAVERYRAHITGVTISREQVEYAALLAGAGLPVCEAHDLRGMATATLRDLNGKLTRAEPLRSLGSCPSGPS